MTIIYVVMVCGPMCFDQKMRPLAVRDYTTSAACEAEAKRLIREVPKPGEFFTAWCIAQPQ